MLSIHSLGRGLLGYLIPFAPHAFVAQCQVRSSKLPSHLVFLPILMDFTPTPAIPFASPDLNFSSFKRGFWVEPRDLTFNLLKHLPTLYAQ